MDAFRRIDKRSAQTTSSDAKSDRHGSKARKHGDTAGSDSSDYSSSTASDKIRTDTSSRTDQTASSATENAAAAEPPPAHVGDSSGSLKQVPPATSDDAEPEKPPPLTENPALRHHSDSGPEVAHEKSLDARPPSTDEAEPPLPSTKLFQYLSISYSVMRSINM
jgi:hypothetical protein